MFAMPIDVETSSALLRYLTRYGYALPHDDYYDERVDLLVDDIGITVIYHIQDEPRMLLIGYAMPIVDSITLGALREAGGLLPRERACELVHFHITMCPKVKLPMLARELVRQALAIYEQEGRGEGVPNRTSCMGRFRYWLNRQR